MILAVDHSSDDRLKTPQRKIGGELAQRESNKKYKTKLTPITVDPFKLYYTYIVFARIVCVLLSFFACKFPAKYETRFIGEIIVDCN